MKKMKISISEGAKKFNLQTKREVIDIKKTNFIDVCSVLLTQSDLPLIQKVKETGFGIPIFVVIEKLEGEEVDDDLLKLVKHVIDDSSENVESYNKKIEFYSSEYEKKVDSPFFRALKKYCKSAKNQFDCPGHQGGNFFNRHPSGKSFMDFFGENLFRADFCNADVELGDFLIHEGVPLDSEAMAAKVFNADKTYFVLNGSSTSLRIVHNALLTPGDLVLYDRNNHKSNCNGALIESGATPIYLATGRNAF